MTRKKDYEDLIYSFENRLFNLGRVLLFLDKFQIEMNHLKNAFKIKPDHSLNLTITLLVEQTYHKLLIDFSSFIETCIGQRKSFLTKIESFSHFINLALKVNQSEESLFEGRYRRNPLISKLLGLKFSTIKERELDIKDIKYFLIYDVELSHTYEQVKNARDFLAHQNNDAEWKRISKFKTPDLPALSDLKIAYNKFKLLFETLRAYFDGSALYYDEVEEMLQNDTLKDLNLLLFFHRIENLYYRSGSYHKKSFIESEVITFEDRCTQLRSNYINEDL